MKKYLRVFCLALTMCLLSSSACLAIDLSKFQPVDFFDISGLAKYVYLYEESDGYGWAQWDRASGNKLSFRAKLYNHSTTRTLKAAELYYYTEDVWGERTHSGEYYHTSKVTLEPGEKGYSDWVNLPGYDEISEVYCGIKRLVFTDGKTVEYDDDEIDYKCWTVD